MPPSQVCSMYIPKCSEHFDRRIQTIQNQQYESSTLLEDWSPSMLTDIDNEVETFPVNLYVNLKSLPK